MKFYQIEKIKVDNKHVLKTSAEMININNSPGCSGNPRASEIAAKDGTGDDAELNTSAPDKKIPLYSQSAS